MLYQWRYKILRRFGTLEGGIVKGEELSLIVGSKPRPKGFRLYKPTRKRFDFVDYTGNEFGKNVERDEITTLLIGEKYIQYIEKKLCK